MAAVETYPVMDPKISGKVEDMIQRNTFCREGKKLIEVKNLVKRYGSHLAVDHLNFTVESGQIYGFLGLKRCGKIYNNEYYDGVSRRHGRRSACQWT